MFNKQIIYNLEWPFRVEGGGTRERRVMMGEWQNVSMDFLMIYSSHDKTV